MNGLTDGRTTTLLNATCGSLPLESSQGQTDRQTDRQTDGRTTTLLNATCGSLPLEFSILGFIGTDR